MNHVLLTTSEVADRMRVDISTVRRWVAKDRLKPAFVTPGGHYRFTEADLAQIQGDESA